MAIQEFVFYKLNKKKFKSNLNTFYKNENEYKYYKNNNNYNNSVNNYASFAKSSKIKKIFST